MLTARVGDSDKEKALEAGADGYLTKPFQPEELFSLVGTLLK
jgi:DNA-binding response OmpR family regulator